MGTLARSGHGRCAIAPGMVAGPAEESMPPSSTPTRPALTRSRPASSRRVLGGRTPVAVAAIAAVVLAALSPAFRLATVSADGVPGLPDITFFGRGYGHGVGL